MKKYFIVIAIVVVLVVIVVVLNNSGEDNLNANQDKTSTQQLKEGQLDRNADTNSNPAPDFSLEDYQGQKVSLADFKGKPLVINSWAAWCPFCRKELPDLAEVQKEFGDQVIFIAIDRAESLATAKKYSDELAVSGKMVFLLDPGDSFYRSIGGFSMPETIFVDSNGNIDFHKRGPMTVDEIRTRTEKIVE